MYIYLNYILNITMRKKIKEKTVSSGKICAIEGCEGEGDYKAPKSRLNTDEYQHLCLEHVKEFNRLWDYFDGWSRKDIENFMDSANYGHRPTWKPGMQPFFTQEKLQESFFAMLGEKVVVQSNQYTPKITKEQKDALATLNMPIESTLAQIKAQYKKLVKKHHPDVNKGDKISEDIFKNITVAYKLLIDSWK